MHHLCPFVFALVFIKVNSLNLNCYNDTWEYKCCEVFNLQTLNKQNNVRKSYLYKKIILKSGVSIMLSLKDKSMSRGRLTTFDPGVTISIYNGFEKRGDGQKELVRNIPVHDITNGYYEGVVNSIDRLVNNGVFSGNYRNGQLTGALIISDINFVLISIKRIQYICTARSKNIHNNIMKDRVHNKRYNNSRDRHSSRIKRSFLNNNGINKSAYSSTPLPNASPSNNASTNNLYSSQSNTSSPYKSISNDSETSESSSSFTPKPSTKAQRSKSPSKSSSSKFKYSHSSSFSNEYRVCKLHFVVDITFYKKRCSSSISCCLAYVEYLVKYSDSKYRGVDFNYDGVSDNIGFVVQKVKYIFIVIRFNIIKILKYIVLNMSI